MRSARALNWSSNSKNGDEDERDQESIQSSAQRIPLWTRLGAWGLGLDGSASRLSLSLDLEPRASRLEPRASSRRAYFPFGCEIDVRSAAVILLIDAPARGDVHFRDPQERVQARSGADGDVGPVRVGVAAGEAEAAAAVRPL